MPGACVPVYCVPSVSRHKARSPGSTASSQRTAKRTSPGFPDVQFFASRDLALIFPVAVAAVVRPCVQAQPLRTTGDDDDDDHDLFNLDSPHLQDQLGSLSLVSKRFSLLNEYVHVTSDNFLDSMIWHSLWWTEGLVLCFYSPPPSVAHLLSECVNLRLLRLKTLHLSCGITYARCTPNRHHRSRLTGPSRQLSCLESRLLGGL